MQFTFHTRTITVNMPTRGQLMEEIHRRFAARQGFALATVNLDHLVKMQGSEGFTAAYAAQDLVVADGWPIVALSRLARRPVELMPGSDLILPLCHLAADTGVKVGFVGSTDEALEAAREALQTTVPKLDVAMVHAPPMGFDPEGAAAAEILEELESKEISLCFLALGAPKQEALAARGRRVAPSVGFASIGAGLDFLSGRQHRAPRLFQRLGLEWLWRALSSPRRLIPRYARCFAILPAQVGHALSLRRRTP
ncbi:WecB/TagA/CpsF family glycosyltransferase [Roseovarius faecimaris]|nr:WecB/TagA/CpsF family glycosyltransferase [Roseovarius faecimaris]